MVLSLLEDTHMLPKRCGYTPILGVTEDTTVKSFFSERAGELLNDKMKELVESQTRTEGFVRHLTMSSTLTMPVTCFPEQHRSTSVDSDTNFRQKVSREVPMKWEVMPWAPMTCHSLESSNTTKENQKKKKEDTTFQHHDSKSSFV